MIVIEKLNKMYYKDVIFDPESEKLSINGFNFVKVGYFEAHA